MKKILVSFILISILLLTSQVFAGNCKLYHSGVVPSDYENTVIIENDGVRKVYQNVKIIQYSSNYWVIFETMDGEVYKFNTGERMSIAIKYNKYN